MPARAVYTIPPGVSFVDALAAGLFARADGDPMALADMRVLLPTRRACRALTDAFLRLSNGAALLPPSMTPIGDVDEVELALTLGRDGSDDVPPAIPDLRRRLLLTRLILQHREQQGGSPLRADQASRLADELAHFLDEVQTARLSFDRLAGLVPDEYADHWRITLQFLKIVIEHWPEIVAAEGCIDHSERRNRLIQAQIERWRAAPPEVPVIVAGSTGSVPATADLIATVTELPNGAVVLPGLDRTLDDLNIGLMQPTHPQFAMVQLLNRVGIAPVDVADWPPADSKPTGARAVLLRSAMLPAGAAPDRLDTATAQAAVESVSRIDCATPQEEAMVIALKLRAVLETPGKTGALVTPDRSLARRVAAELRRWDIDIDDSAGTALGHTPVGVFLRLTADMVAERGAPVPLLACLKHPLSAGGGDPGRFRAKARALERAALRGPRPRAGFDGLREALESAKAEDSMTAWVDDIAERSASFEGYLSGSPAPFADILSAHIAFAEWLAGDGTVPGADRLWRGDAGQTAALFVGELLEAAATLGRIGGSAYPALLESLMHGRVVRPRFGRHPRLHIWGPLEARLQQTDLLILGGLNEGAWPPDPATDPWMSRPMRARFGLPSAERRIGLSAHDFAQAFAAPEVLLTRATRVEGTPTVPSRWLLRLDNVLAAAGAPGGLRSTEQHWLSWQAALSRPALQQQTRAPGPCPPVAARPRRLSVTQIETLIRDPYAIYARHVLRLRPLEPLDADPAAAERGTAIHDALDAFLKRYPDELPATALDGLLEIGAAEFGPMLNRPGVLAFWWPRFRRIAQWFVDQERARRPGLRTVHSEVTGTIEFDAPAGPFVLTGKADRIDESDDGALQIIDYKTGSIPRRRDMEQGFSPQLPLEAVILADGGFPDIEPAVPHKLALWHLTGGNPPASESIALTGDLDALVDRVRAGVRALIAQYDDPEMPYRSRPSAGHAPARSDYDHLARVKEWPMEDGAP